MSLPRDALPAHKPFRAELTLQRLTIAVLFAVAVAAALNPHFETPFSVLLGRTLVIAMLMLVVFVAAGRLPSTWLPSWLARLLAVVFTVPVATYVVYLPAAGGDPLFVWRNEWYLSGYLLIAGMGLLIGPLLALVALYRERDAQARADGLQFALERSTLERQALDAQLRLLHAQIEPHFLFNTLANVQALVESGSPQAAPLLGHLIAYLRAAMPRLNDTHPTLGTEAELVTAYLRLMRMRMPDRLVFDVDVPDALKPLRFPPMSLLTLVENAIRHAIDPSERGGRIEVGAARDDGSNRVRVWVADDGAGMDPKAAPGTGLNNLRARLAGFLGEGAELRLSELSPHGLRAEIVFDAPPPEGR